MQNFIDSIRQSLESKNWFGALFLALCIPDICGKLEFGDIGNKVRYSKWFESNLGTKYNPSFTGDDCYYFRCACLHEASDVHDKLPFDRIHFICPPINGNIVHKNMLNNVLQLQIDKFCEDICIAIEDWQIKMMSNIGVTAKLKTLIEIYKFNSINGFVSFEENI